MISPLLIRSLAKTTWANTVRPELVEGHSFLVRQAHHERKSSVIYFKTPWSVISSSADTFLTAGVIDFLFLPPVPHRFEVCQRGMSERCQINMHKKKCGKTAGKEKMCSYKRLYTTQKEQKLT
jgi:hypothetical protein